MIAAVDIDSHVQQLVKWDSVVGNKAALYSQWTPAAKYRDVPMSISGGVVTLALSNDVALAPSAMVFGVGGLNVSTSYTLVSQQVVLLHPLLNDPAVEVFLRANPYADRQAMRQIYEEVASKFSGAALTCTSAADMDTGKWHLYLDVDTHGELDIDAQIEREMDLHSAFLQNQQLRHAKEYFHVTVS
ncbi:MAG: hypothetical protein KAX88_00255 [Rhodoferax sp.]|nr:hypothetical protein [Rhodoferax sp.]MBP9059970.1 hypothetical protein [Rhodoferax sp.]